jgi:hypothetical protein
MKLLSSVLMLGLSLSAFAQLSVREQTALVEGIAKNERREMWRLGMTNVSSLVTRPTKTQIDELIRDNGTMSDLLNRDEIASIYSCHHRPATCVVFTIDLGGEMYGGAGATRHCVLLSPATGRYRSIVKEVYSE